MPSDVKSEVKMDDAKCRARCDATPSTGMSLLKAVLWVGIPLMILGGVLGAWLFSATGKAGEKQRHASMTTDEGHELQAMAMGATFKRLAGVDFRAALAMSATPQCRQTWNQTAEGMFSGQIDAAAFFDTAFVQLLQNHASAFSLMIYNPWIDAAVVAVFETVGTTPQITQLKIVAKDGPGRPRLTQAGLLQEELQRRLSEAAETDWASLPFTREACRPIQMALTEYRKSLRDALAPEAGPEGQALSDTIGLLLEQCRAASPDAGLLADQPLAWRAALHPVYLHRDGGKSLLALTASTQPGRWLLVEILQRGQTLMISRMTVGSVNSSQKQSTP
ncbi:MAG: hypothetical protein U1F71_12675 [Verrucomicrobiaceae bacterium]